MVRKRPAGMALPLMLLLLLAITAVAHATLLLALREMQASWAFRHAIRASQAAELGNRLALEGSFWSLADRAGGAAEPLVQGETDDGFRFRSEVRWLDQEFFLLEGTGGSRGWKGERRRGRAGWSLSPAARLGAFDAVVELGGVATLEDGAVVESSDPSAPPTDWDFADCAGVQSVMDSLFSGTRLPAWGPVRDPVGPGLTKIDSLPPLGLLDGNRLLGRLPALSFAARPGAFSGASAGCPPGGPPRVGGSEGDLVLESGSSCGILVVAGDLTLRSPVRFQGLILVGGNLLLQDGAIFEGLARVRGDVRLKSGSRISAAACPALVALEESEVLRRPVLLTRAESLTGY